MGENFSSGRPGRYDCQPGRRTSSQKRRANRALASLKPLPDPAEGPVATGVFGLSHRRRDASGHGLPQECPHGSRGQTQPADLAGEPDTDGPAATMAAMAITAKDSPGADSAAVATVIEADKHAVPDQHADNAAMRACRQLEPLDKRGPLRFITIKPSLAAHGADLSAKFSEGTCSRKQRERAGSNTSGQTTKTQSSNSYNPNNQTLKGFPNSRGANSRRIGSQFGNNAA